jgi:hypothetical protein
LMPTLMAMRDSSRRKDDKPKPVNVSTARPRDTAGIMMPWPRHAAFPGLSRRRYDSLKCTHSTRWLSWFLRSCCRHGSWTRRSVPQVLRQFGHGWAGSRQFQLTDESTDSRRVGREALTPAHSPGSARTGTDSGSSSTTTLTGQQLLDPGSRTDGVLPCRSTCRRSSTAPGCRRGSSS